MDTRVATGGNDGGRDIIVIGASTGSIGALHELLDLLRAAAAVSLGGHESHA